MGLRVCSAGRSSVGLEARLCFYAENSDYGSPIRVSAGTGELTSTDWAPRLQRPARPQFWTEEEISLVDSLVLTNYKNRAAQTRRITRTDASWKLTMKTETISGDHLRSSAHSTFDLSKRKRLLLAISAPRFAATVV